MMIVSKTALATAAAKKGAMMAANADSRIYATSERSLSTLGNSLRSAIFLLDRRQAETHLPFLG